MGSGFRDAGLPCDVGFVVLADDFCWYHAEVGAPSPLHFSHSPVEIKKQIRQNKRYKRLGFSNENPKEETRALLPYPSGAASAAIIHCELLRWE